MDSKFVANGLAERESPLQVAKEAGILGEHESLLNAISRAILVARTNFPILLLGERGTGKELFARMIHSQSSVRNGPLFPINCAGLNESLADSQLFGYVRGAFIGADRDRRGAFEEYSRGTVFLDEIGDMPLATQAKLLRFLQEGKITPVGSVTEVEARPRIIAATNVDLGKARREGKFRDDLADRLQYQLRLPPLRERASDIPVVANALLRRFVEGEGKDVRSIFAQKLSEGALRKLRQHSWPGNVRELKSVIEIACIEVNKEEIVEGDIRFAQDSQQENDGIPLPALCEGFNLTDYLEKIRENAITRALSQSAGNIAQAARLLGMKRQSLAQWKARRVDKRAMSIDGNGVSSSKET